MSFLGKKTPEMPTTGTAQEDLTMRNMAGLLAGGRAGLEEGAFQQNILAPYQYEQAGLEATYEDRATRMADLQRQTDRLAQFRTELAGAKGKGKGARGAVRKAYADVTGGLKGKKLKTYLAKAEKEMADLANAPLRMTGLKETEAAKAERMREGEIYKTSQEMLQKSLGMTPEEVLAADPALKRQLEEEQAKLQQAQVGQFGSLAATQGGTVGAVQNATMAQRRAEAISNARRENIGLYSGLSTGQGTYNLQKAAAKQALAGSPSAAQQASAMSFGQLAQGYSPILQAKQARTAREWEKNKIVGLQPGWGEKVMGGIGGMLQPWKGMGGGGGGGSS